MLTTRMRMLVLTGVMALLACGLSAQTTTTEILTGATQTTGSGSGYPLNTFWEDCRTESIYLASELSAAGINPNARFYAIQFRCAEVPGQSLPNMRIRMQHTSASTVTGTYTSSGFTDMYGPTTVSTSSFSVGSWFTFTFSTPFTWNGTDNIIIDYSTDGTSWTSYGGVYLRSVSGPRTTYGYDDSLYNYPFAGMEVGTRTTVPALRIEHDAGGLGILTASPLPNAGEGASYTPVDITAAGGSTPYTWSHTGTIPPGMSLTQVGDVYRLSGTPNAGTGGNNYSFTATVNDGSNIDQKLFTIDVDGLVITPTSAPSGAEGATYPGQTFSVTNGSSPYTWGATGVPNGLIFTQSGDDYILSGTPATGTGGQTHNITITVSDINSSSTQEVVQVFISGPPAQLPFNDDFSTDKGWTLGSGGVTWQRAPAAANTNGEPTTDTSPSTDNYILGDNIGSDYPANMSSTVWAVSPAVDCSGISDVELSFQRWLGVENDSWDHAYIEVSPNNGTSWTQVWANGASTINETAWSLQKLNISAVAGNQSAVRVRFGIGTTDSSVQHHGWSIDDFEIRELPSTTKLVLTDFTITSPYSVGTTTPAPKCYTGSQYTFDLTMDNTTGNPIEVTSVTFTVTEFGSTSPENVGSWTLAVTVPFTVPANTTGHNVSGTFDCQSLSSSGAGIALENLCKIQGTEQNTNKPVESELGETFYLETGPPPPPPSMEVHEISFSGPTVDSGQSAATTNRDFGNVDIDAGPTSWVNIVIINSTGANIDVNTPTLTGTDAAHFRLDTAQWTSGTMTLTTSGASSQIYFSVRFDPHDLGQRDAQVEFTHTATTPSNNPFVVPITGNGTGTAPELEVHEIDYTGPQVTNGQAAAGTNRDFGSVAAGGFSQWVNIVLWNRFVTDTTIDPLPTLTGADAAEFDIDTSAMNNPHTIPGTTGFTGTTYFSVRFAPSGAASAGVKTATVTFGHNASNPATTPFTFEVTGTVTASGTSFSVYELSGGAPSFSIANGATAANGRDFGSQVITAGPTAWLEVEINNTGSTAITLGTPQLTGTQAGEFVLDTTTPVFTTNLAAGNTTEFWIAFDPTTAGQKTATVEFTHTATSQTTSPFTFEVTGLGVANAPKVEVREGSTTGPTVSYNATAAGTNRNFGSQDVNAGATTALTIVVMNTGFQDMNVGTPVLAGTDAGEFSLSATGFPAVVSPGNNVSFDVAFDPSSYGNKSAQVEFTHDDPGTTSPFTFEVTGFGDAPAIEVHEGTAGGPIISHGAAPTGGRDFGTVLLSAMPSAPVTIVIVNAGNADLTVQQPTITGPNASSFTLNLGATTFPATVSASSSLSFDVSFDAAQVGLKEATVNVGHNDAGVTSPFTFDIQGTADDPAGVRITSSATLPATKVGVTYGPETLRATGGTTPYTWALRPGSSLPGGLALSSSGDIQGTVTASTGIYQFEIRVTDSAGGTDDQVFSIAIGSDQTSGGGGGGGGGGCASHTDSPVLWLLMFAMGVFGVARVARRRQWCRA